MTSVLISYPQFRVQVLFRDQLPQGPYAETIREKSAYAVYLPFGSSLQTMKEVLLQHCGDEVIRLQQSPTQFKVREVKFNRHFVQETTTLDKVISDGDYLDVSVKMRVESNCCILF
jgi:hypothetical protein